MGKSKSEQQLAYSPPSLDVFIVEDQTLGGENIVHESNNGYYS